MNYQPFCGIYDREALPGTVFIVVFSRDCCSCRGQGTSKEYIGDDTEEIKKAVKHALQQCCLQLKSHLVRRNALRDQRERKKVLTKVKMTCSLLTIAQKIMIRDNESQFVPKISRFVTTNRDS